MRFKCVYQNNRKLIDIEGKIETIQARPALSIKYRLSVNPLLLGVLMCLKETNKVPTPLYIYAQHIKQKGKQKVFLCSNTALNCWPSYMGGPRPWLYTQRTNSYCSTFPGNNQPKTLTIKKPYKRLPAIYLEQIRNLYGCRLYTIPRQ